MAEEKKEGFVVRDRRKFNAEGELRPDAPSELSSEVKSETQSGGSSTSANIPPASPPPLTSHSQGESSSASRKQEEAGPDAPAEMPEPPTEAEQTAQHADYRSAGSQLDSLMQERGAAGPLAEMNMERLISSLYMTAMMQMGMFREEGSQMRVDIIGARQTIDTVALLQDKTKGNLTERESHMLQNVLFELRMAFIEITRAVTTAPPGSAPGEKLR